MTDWGWPPTERGFPEEADGWDSNPRPTAWQAGRGFGPKSAENCTVKPNRVRLWRPSTPVGFPRFAVDSAGFGHWNVTCAQNELRRLLPLPGLNAIEHSQEQVGEENDLGRVCRIVELHLAVARGILEDPDRAGE